MGIHVSFEIVSCGKSLVLPTTASMLAPVFWDSRQMDLLMTIKILREPESLRTRYAEVWSRSVVAVDSVDMLPDKMSTTFDNEEANGRLT